MILFRARVIMGVLMMSALAFGETVPRVKSYYFTNATAAEKWPENARLARARDLPTMVVFLHPHCYNAATTLSELKKLLPALKGKARVYISFYAPTNRDDSWLKRGVWPLALRLHNVNVYRDTDGADSELFGAQSSGEVFLYDVAGQMIFHGGLTKTWNFIGANEGRDAILAWAADQSKPFLERETPVWGRNLRLQISLGMLDLD